MKSPGPARSVARQLGREQSADQDRAHRALPRTHAPRRHPSEFTITKIADEHFYVVSAGAASATMRLPETMLPHQGDTARASGRQRYFTEYHDEPRYLRVAGPRSREVLAKTYRYCARQRRIPVAHRPGCRSRTRRRCVPVAVELRRCASAGNCTSHRYAHHCSTRFSPPVRNSRSAWPGMRAMESLRIEKSYRIGERT